MAKPSKEKLAVISGIEEKALSIPDKITTEDELYAATDLILRARKMANEVDEKRKERTAPMNESLSLINADYAIYLHPLQALEKKLKASIEEFANEKINQDLEKLEKIRENSGDNNLMIPIGYSNLPGNFGEVRFRKNHIVTITDETKVPKKYKTVDVKAIQKAIDAVDGELKIPGVDVKVVSSTAIYLK